MQVTLASFCILLCLPLHSSFAFFVAVVPPSASRPSSRPRLLLPWPSSPSPLPTPLFALSYHPQLIHSGTHTHARTHTRASSSENAMRQFTMHFNRDASLQRPWCLHSTKNGRECAILNPTPAHAERQPVATSRN
ncbi:unnamed protein product [Mortierella alpina]